MQIIQKIIKERKFVDPKDGKTKSRFGYRGHNKIAWIIVHYTGDYGSQGCAKKTADAMQTWKRTVSTHYLVGDDAIYQTVKDKHVAWHCPYDKDNKCAACNSNALGVDLVEHKRNTRTHSVKDRDWYFTDKVIQDGAQLVAWLADKYNIPQSHIVRHFDVTGKWCPRPFVGKDTNEITGDIHEIGWIMFKERVRLARANRELAEC
ncbi:MAG: N-acetylmuramoyl-L-alanine amidase [Proteobacteria bacterium]|nr:N-acetylmuramoyl-L-alanine amidase [Pseudomonadota bacterium]